ncbi:aspartyl beta-hydroxylase [Pedobacter ginsengisoli]|uniref:Aspartyl beta-hydroxylase n=1 Tax=Pedobacter ginsengisoli TaxID=363852 RepID=A0A2D1U779_9SPHI|nr:aspartyl/asparaginyl beta-hydroxylase domain-containing protein [Pedobacter ginsengisoli]ATP57440.1 aspartyl beta-hydroxylase [Pedobacter ginsengisoli]
MRPTYIKFALNYDVQKLQQELQSCLEQEWPLHFNTRDFDGTWKSISLRSASGSATDIYAHPNLSTHLDTPLLDNTPYIKEILDSWQCEKENVRLLALSPGSHIKPHRDNGCAYKDGAFRIHIPITSNPGVYFTIEDQQLQLQEGECWYMDFSKTHEIINEGKTTRVHLIIDALKNEWTDQLFEQHGYPVASDQDGNKYDEDTITKMIAQLTLMNTPTADAIIARLRSKKI